MMNFRKLIGEIDKKVKKIKIPAAGPNADQSESQMMDKITEEVMRLKSELQELLENYKHNNQQINEQILRKVDKSDLEDAHTKSS